MTPFNGLPPAPAEVSHLRATDASGAVWTLTALAGSGAGVWLGTRVGWLPWMTGQVILAAALVQWFVMLHECGHGTLFHTRRLNTLVGHLSAFAALMPFHAWKRVHDRHHKWTGWQDVDPTTAALVPRVLSRAERLVINVCWRYWIPLFATVYRTNNFWNVPRLIRLFPLAAVRRRILLNIAVLTLVYAALALLLGPRAVLRTAGVALILALIVEDILLISQHTHVPMGLSHGEPVDPYPAMAQQPFTRSLRLPAWTSRLLLHFDAHELHHMYPFVPGYRLLQIPYAPGNEVAWWRWVPAARAVPADVLMFHNRDETGLDV